MQDEATIALLRSPIDLKPLHEISHNALVTDDGTVFPIVDGVLCLLPEAERNQDLGDDRFYEFNPFGERDWMDAEDVAAGVESELEQVLDQLTRADRIIDVGCGAGRISNYLSRQGYKNTVSLDFSLNSLKQVKNNSHNVCIWGNNLHLPIASDSFDLVISTGVVHHTPAPHQALSECIRVIKPGGRIYLRIYNLFSLYAVLYHTYGRLLRTLQRFAPMRSLTDNFGLRMYKLVRICFKRLPIRDERILRAKFNNLFMKDMVHFFTARDLEQVLDDHSIEIEYSIRSGIVHRMLCYVARKRA